MRGILTTGMACVGRILKTGIWVFNINLLDIRLTENLPNRGKHRAHDGQARCPTWASSVPIFCSFDYPYIYKKVMKPNVTTSGKRQA